MAGASIREAWLAAIPLLAACSAPSPPSLSDQALAALKHRLGPGYELQHVAERTVQGHRLLCGIAGPIGDGSAPNMFVYSQGRLYLTEDMKPDSEAFLAKNCGSDLPRAPRIVAYDPAPR